MTKTFPFFQFDLPDTVSILEKQNTLQFTGPLGSTYLNLKKLDKQGRALFALSGDGKNLQLYIPCRSFYTTICTLIESKIKGVSRGFRIMLRLKGIGYRASYSNPILSLFLGFSHTVEFHIPPGVHLVLLEPTLICLYGLDLNQVTQIGSQLRAVRTPSRYGQKGVFLE